MQVIIYIYIALVYKEKGKKDYLQLLIACVGIKSKTIETEIVLVISNCTLLTIGIGNF